jgi:hypothetical protein
LSRRFTVEQRKKIKTLVLEGICQHKTTGDIRHYIKENIGFEISEAETKRYRQALRKEAHQWITVLAKSKYEYIAEYRQRIQEVENNQKELWKLYNDPRSSYELKRQCQMDLARLSSMLMNMYDAMPIVNEIIRRKSIIDYDDNISSNDNNSIDSVTAANTYDK